MISYRARSPSDFRDSETWATPTGHLPTRVFTNNGLLCLREFRRVVLDLPHRHGNIVHVGACTQERRLRQPDGGLTQTVIDRTLNMLEILGNPLRCVDRLKRPRPERVG